MATRLRPGSSFLYDSDTGDIVGVKDIDGSELFFMRIPHTGSWLDLSDQTASADTATAMEFDTVVTESGITVVDLSKVTFSRKARYNLQFSAQLVNTGNDESTVSIWLKKNNGNVADSNTDITVPKKHAGGDGKLVAAWNFFLDLEAGDYVELMWSSTSADTSIQYIAARNTPTRPATPSIILTVNEVDGSYP